MSGYRRAWVPGGTYFFRVVTCRQRRFLIALENRDALRRSIEEARARLPYLYRI